MVHEKIDALIADAMKSRNDVQLRVLRSFKNACSVYEKIQAGNKVDDAIEVQILQKMAAQRKDSYSQYMNAGRTDLAIAEKEELDLIESYLPKEPSDEEISETIDLIISAFSYPVSMKDLKSVIASVKSQYSTADSGKIAKIFKTKL